MTNAFKLFLWRARLREIVEQKCWKIVSKIPNANNNFLTLSKNKDSKLGPKDILAVNINIIWTITAIQLPCSVKCELESSIKSLSLYPVVNII